MATRKTTKSTRPATSKRGAKKPRKLREHVAKLSPSSLWSYAKYNKKHTAVFVLLFVAIGSFVVYKSLAVITERTQASTGWSWSASSGAGHGTIEHDLVIDSVAPEVKYFWSHQASFQNAPAGAGVFYFGLQNNGNRVNGSWGKTAVFSVFGAGIEGTPGSCMVQQSGFDEGYYQGPGTSCRVPYDWSGNTSYRLKVTRGTTVGANTWWIGIVNGTEIGRFKVPSSWGGIRNSSSMWTEFHGTSTLPGCTDFPYSRVRFSKPIVDGSMVQSSPNNKIVECPNAKVTSTPSGITQEVGIPPLPPPPNVKDCKSDGTCPRCSIAVTGNSRGTWTATWSSSNLGTSKNGWGATLKNSATGAAPTTDLPVNGSRTVVPLSGVYNTYTLNIYDGWAISNVSCAATIRPGGDTTPPPPAPPPPPATAYCNISVTKNSSGTWIGSWRTYNIGAAQYGWGATLQNSGTGAAPTTDLPVNGSRTLIPRKGYSNTYTLKIYDGWAATSTQCSTTVKG
jgi:hypothetical protein